MRVVESKDTKHRLNAICDGVAPGVGVREVSSFGQKLHDSQTHTCTILAILKQKIELGERIPRERCKGVHFVDLGESFPTYIFF